MADKYLRFDTLELPNRAASHQIGTHKAESPVAVMSNGLSYRLLGTDTARGAKMDLRVSGRIVADSDFGYSTALNSYRMLRGKFGQLYRFNEITQDSVWAYAECAQINSIRATENRRHIDVDLDFNVFSEVWNGAAHSPGPNVVFATGVLFGSGRTFNESAGDVITLNTSPKTFSLTNDGDAPQRSVAFILTPAATITAFTLTGPGFGWTWNGSLPVGTQLVLDNGNRTIRKLTGGVYSPAYTLTLDLTRMTSLEWLTLGAGSTSLTATITGGGTTSTLGFTYNDGWY
jgi:hypothetical protein